MQCRQFCHIVFCIMPIKYSINFTLNKRDNVSCVPLRFRISWGKGLRIGLNVGYAVEVEQWNQSKQRCEKKSVHGKMKIPAQVINKTISTIEDKVAEIFADFDRQGIVPTKEQLKEAVTPRTENKAVRNIQSYYMEYISEGETMGWSEGTIKRAKSMRSHLREFDENLTFDDINEDFHLNLISYFQQKGIANVTTNKYVKIVQTFVRWAEGKGYCKCEEFLRNKSRLKTIKKSIIFLEWEELMALYNFDFGRNKCYEAVRDCFCFACFTSLRYSDIASLKKTDISETTITVTTIKTGTSLVIELNKYSKAIIAKYKDVPLPNNTALPCISNQKSNDYIKEICKLVGIDRVITHSTYKGNTRIDITKPKWELMSFHAGRRTFISNALMMGVSPNIVMKWSGHSSYKAMVPYIEMADEAKRQAMTVFDKR